MQLDKVTLDGKQLVTVDSAFGSMRPDFRKTVTLNFTDGKINDARWANEKKATLGLTKPSGVNVDAASRLCTGDALIDLTEILLNAGTPAQTVGRTRIAATGPSPKQFRYLSVICVVHELMHVHQGWQLGKGFAKAMFDEKISAEARAKDYAEANRGMPDDAYLQNQFEQGARDFAGRWSDAHGDEIHTGKFDFLLPIATMRSFFPGMALPF